LAAIPRQIRHASGHDHLAEERIERDDRVRVGKAGQRNALVGEELLDHRRVPGVHHERDIDLSRLEHFRGFARAQRQEFADLPFRAGTLDQFQRQHARAAAWRPDRDLAAAQAVGPHALVLAPAEPPQRLVGHGA
jgi:hypothetical protein